MSKEKQELSEDISAREGAMKIIDEYNDGGLSIGKYAYKLVSETYINLITQAQSGMQLHIEGQILDLKTVSASRIANTNKYLNGYRIGKYAINFQQDTPAILGNYDENANLIIVSDGYLIQEQLDNPECESGTIIYKGAFKNVTQEGLNILERCLKFSALNYDMLLDKKLLEKFSFSIRQNNKSLSDLPLLGDQGNKHK